MRNKATRFVINVFLIYLLHVLAVITFVVILLNVVIIPPAFMPRGI